MPLEINRANSANARAPRSSYPILSFDGGGVRGVLGLVVLDRLQRARPFLQQVSLFAGTSTGGLIALGLAAGFRPNEISKLYLDCAKAVFQDSALDDVVDLGRLIGAEYSNASLKTLLEERFGDCRLGELERHVLIPAFDLDNEHPDTKRRTWKPKFFHNFRGPDMDGDTRVVDVALRTTAAPTYFPVYQGYIDGGVMANNPAMCALAQAIDWRTGGRQLDELVLLSLGTGKNPRYLDVTDEDWGLAQWARHLLNILLEGHEGTAHYQCQRALGDRYRRIDPWLHTPVNLDDIDLLDDLIRLGRRLDLSECLGWIDRYFD